MLLLECGRLFSKKSINLDRLIDRTNFPCNAFLGFTLFCFKFTKSSTFESIASKQEVRFKFSK